MARAATTRLEPGHHSIDRAQPFPTETGWALRWRLRLPSGKLLDKTTKAPTKAEVRAKARRTADSLLKAPGNTNWTPTSPVLAYMEAVALPAIRAERLADATTRRYELAYRLLRGECGQKHKHLHSLAGLSIHDAMRPRNLTRCLEEIGELHGAKNVKHAKTVAKKYLAGPLRVDELIEFNPLADLDVDLSRAKRPEIRRGGHALSLEEYRKVIDHLLAADSRPVPRPRRGRWSHELQVAQRAQVTDVVLAQATTGLRTSELATRPVAECSVDKDGTFIFWLPDAAVKTRRGRPVPVLDPRVSKRLEARLKVAKGKHLFSAPSDPASAWDPRTRDRKIAALYQEMAEALEIPLLAFERGHLWRTTLNTLLYDELPEATRTRLLGHTPAVNRQFYTAVTSTRAVVEAASILRDDPQESPQESPQETGNHG